MIREIPDDITVEFEESEYGELHCRLCGQRFEDGDEMQSVTVVAKGTPWDGERRDYHVDCYTPDDGDEE